MQHITRTGQSFTFDPRDAADLTVGDLILVALPTGEDFGDGEQANIALQHMPEESYIRYLIGTIAARYSIPCLDSKGDTTECVDVMVFFEGRAIEATWTLDDDDQVYAS
jgi:hypothetical protein